MKKLKMSDNFSAASERYNSYINKILEQIKDFDVWYETVENRIFPKEWYSLIKKRGKLSDK